ncbi:MAG: phosphoethanolamine transferase, partial [Bdellovibrionales bacterium]
IPELSCKGEECTDLVFLDVLDEQIESLSGEDGIIYLHLLGSHGPSYHQRYPESHAKFKPDCQTSDLQRCTKEEIINAYDNTILFTDYVMSQVIESLDKYKDNYYTGVVYMSDHGESLGENGLYLHGAPYAFAPEEQTQVPLIVWFSDKMVQHEGFDIKCLKKVAQTRDFSHDNLSHTFLDLMDIETEIYDSKKDMLDMCADEDQEEH